MLVQELEKDSRSYFDENVEKKKQINIQKENETQPIYLIYIYFFYQYIIDYYH